jgi:hypothetical protein
MLPRILPLTAALILIMLVVWATLAVVPELRF